jgi:subtilase family serine protease
MRDFRLRRTKDEKCTLLGCYATSYGIFLHNNTEQRSSQAASCSTVVTINLEIQVKFKLLINY